VKLSLVNSLVLGGTLTLTSCLAIASSGNYAWAQISSDGTVGSQVNSPIPGTFLINGGTTRGSNLFHSFSEFSVPSNGFAYFNNLTPIQNIITRVTGGSISNIDGLIRANGTANLFFLNPNGIIFGPNAQLKIGGSFLASTASSINFADGSKFSANASQTKPLLTVSSPLGLQYGNNPGNIQLEMSFLEVKKGQTLALVGGNLQSNHSFLYAPGGRVELGGLSGEGIVGLNVDNNNLNLSFPNNVPLADVSLNLTSVSVSGDGGGNIQVNANRIMLTNKSSLNANIQGSQNGGGIMINASQLILRDGSFIKAATDAKSTGQGASVTVNASDLVEVSGTSADGMAPTAIGTLTKGTGAAGNVNITTRQLIVQGGAEVSANTEGKGVGGILTVIASDSVELIGTTADAKNPSGLFARTKSDAVGGTLTIITGRLMITGGATASTSTSGAGKAGDLLIRASEAVEVRGTSANGYPSILSAQVDQTAKGDAGNLTIQTGRLIVEGGAKVSAATLGKGQGGTLRVNASDFVEIIGTSATGIPSRLTNQTESPKPAGDLIINTRQLIVRNGSQVEAGTFGEGQGGTLIINASDFVKVIGSSANDKTLTGLFVESSGVGAAGDLRITTGELIVLDRAKVSVSSDKTATAGDITVTANSIRLDNRGQITAETASGQGGNINLKVQDVLLMRQGSRISTTAGTAKAGGDGGNIGIDSLFIVAVPKENSDITANAYTGKGGNINITTQGIYGLEFRPRLTPFSDITASSEFGVNGNVQINTSGIDPSRGLNNLPVEPVTLEVTEGCQGEGKPGTVAFFNTGKGGLAPNPYEPKSSSNIWEDVPLSTPKTANSTSPPQTIVEAQSWIVNEKGEVVLVAEIPVTRSQNRCRLR